jgi:hypothetical protein
MTFECAGHAGPLLMVSSAISTPLALALGRHAEHAHKARSALTGAGAESTRIFWKGS